MVCRTGNSEVVSPPLWCVGQVIVRLCHLQLALFGLAVLHMFPQVVADGSEGGVDLHTEITPVAYWGLISSGIQLKGKKTNHLKWLAFRTKCLIGKVTWQNTSDTLLKNMKDYVDLCVLTS